MQNQILDFYEGVTDISFFEVRKALNSLIYFGLADEDEAGNKLAELVGEFLDGRKISLVGTDINCIVFWCAWREFLAELEDLGFKRTYEMISNEVSVFASFTDSCFRYDAKKSEDFIKAIKEDEQEARENGESIEYSKTFKAVWQ